jgi:hypothetical protein
VNDQLDGEIRALLARLEDMTPLPPAFDELHRRTDDVGREWPRWRRPAISVAAAAVVAGGLAATVAIIQARPARTPSGATAVPSTEASGTTSAPATTAAEPQLVDAADAARLLPEIVIEGGRNEQLARLDVGDNYSLRLVSDPDGPNRRNTFCIIEEQNGQESTQVCGHDDNPRTDVGGLLEAVTNQTVSNDPSRGGPRVIVLTAATVNVAANNCDPVTVKTAGVALSLCSPPRDARHTGLTFTNTLDGTVVRINVSITPIDGAGVPVEVDAFPLPDVFPALALDDPRNEDAQGFYSQISPHNGGRTSALIARQNGDLLTDGIEISAFSDRAVDEALAAGGSNRPQAIHGVRVYNMVEPGDPALTTAIVPGQPAIAYRGLDPIGFLTDAGLDVATATVSSDDDTGTATVDLNLVNVPDGFEVIVEPETLALGAVAATLHLQAGDTADGTGITTQLASPLIALASSGDVQAVDINGAPGWITAGPGYVVTWQVGTHTWASVGGNATSDASLELARAAQFVDEASWRARYDVDLPNLSPVTDTTVTGDTTPPTIAYNELETMVIGALAELGLQGETAEHSFTGGPANIRVILSDGTDHTTVDATPTASHGGEYTVVSERIINGVVVEHVDYGTVDGEAFTCRDVRYEARGPTPPGFTDFDQFLSELITALDCEQPD